MNVKQQSVIARKTRNRWYLNANELYEGLSPAIEWGNVLEVGNGTRHQRAYLLKSFKELIDAMVDAPRPTSGRLAHGTVLNWVFSIQRMVRWMVARDIWRFSAMTAVDLNEYIKWCRISDSKEGEVSDFTFSRRIALLREMWELRKRYASSLRVNPDPLAPVLRRQDMRRSSWKALDEGVALRLIGDAIAWIEAYGDYLLTVNDRLWAIDSKVARTVNERKKEKSEFYRGLISDPEFIKIAGELSGRKEVRPFLDLQRAFVIADGACVVLVLFLVGMRIREFSRLDTGCLEVEKLISGESISRINGFAAKQDGRARSWITCEAVNTAIRYLENLYSNGRTSAGSNALMIGRLTGARPSPGFKMYRSQPETLRNKVITFARSPHRTDAALGLRIHPHVARKTFARFVVLRDKSALESLAYHFGHVHREITDGSYVGSDIELSQLLAEEDRKDLASGLSDLLSSTNVGGKAGELLMTYKQSNALKLKGKLGVRKLVNDLIEKGVQIAPCDWGYCVYSQALSACQGDAKGPNSTRRSADVCSTCSNFSVTERHRAWWERRYKDDEEFLRQDGLPLQTTEWVGRRLSNTIQVIRGLNGNSEKRDIDDCSTQK